jgi:hypothetical protein
MFPREPEGDWRSAIGVAAVADSGDGDAVLSGLLEEDAVVSAAEPEAGHGWLEFLHVAAAGGEVAVDAVEDVEGGLAVDGPEFGPCFDRPGNGKPVRSQAELSQNLFVGDALAPVERVAGAVEGGHGLGGQFFVLDGRVGEGSRERFDQEFEQVADGDKLLFRQSVEQGVGLLSLLREIEFHRCSLLFFS